MPPWLANLSLEQRRSLTEYLSEFVTDHKQGLMAKALQHRTRHLTVVLEDLFQPHNGSACLRTCECMGVQDVHIIESRNKYKINREIAMGASKWLTLERYATPDTNNTAECYAALRAKGFQIVATSPHKDGYGLTDLPLDKPTAIVFGTEEMGLSDEALAEADATLRLPMFGFTESYNISVSVAITLARLTERLHESNTAWQLTKLEKDELRLLWHLRVIRNSEIVARKFLDL